MTSRAAHRWALRTPYRSNTAPSAPAVTLTGTRIDVDRLRRQAVDGLVVVGRVVVEGHQVLRPREAGERDRMLDRAVAPADVRRDTR